MSKLRDLLNEVSDFAGETYDSENGPWYYVAIKPNGDRALFAGFVSCHEEEVLFLDMLPLKLRVDGYARWCFWCEAWVGTSGEVLPADQPDHSEALVFVAMEGGDSTEVLRATRQIVRAGDKARLLPLVIMDDEPRFVQKEAR